jgi:hypothetical protein
MPPDTSTRKAFTETRLTLFFYLFLRLSTDRNQCLFAPDNIDIDRKNGLKSLGGTRESDRPRALFFSLFDVCSCRPLVDDVLEFFDEVLVLFYAESPETRGADVETDDFADFQWRDAAAD